MFSSQRRVGLCCLWKLARRSYQTVMMLLLLAGCAIAAIADAAVDAIVAATADLPLPQLLSQLPPPVQGIMFCCEARLYVVMRDCMCLGQW